MLPLAMVLGPPLLKAAIGGIQTGFGLNKLNNLDRPTRTTAPSVSEGTARTRYMSQSGQAPGSEIVQKNIQTNQAAAVSQISKAGGTSGTTMAAAIGAQGTANKAIQQQGIQDQRFKLGANMQYMQMLKQMAEEHQMNFQWNQAQKYQDDADAAKRLTESGMQNFASGITEFGGTAYADRMLNGGNPEESQYWNKKMGYMGTAEHYNKNQEANLTAYNKLLAGPQAPAPSNPMHGKFGEGMNTEGYMNQWEVPQGQFQQGAIPMPIGYQ